MTVREKLDQRLKARQAKKPGRSRQYMKMYKGDEDELEDLDLDEILEVDEDDVEFVDECPPGCAPVDEEGDEDEPMSDDLDLDDEDEVDDVDLDKDAKVDKKPKADEPVQKPETAAAKTDEPDVAEPESDEYYTRLLTEEDIAAANSDDIGVVPMFDLDDPKYLLMSAGVPFGEIRRSSLELDADVEDLFTDESFTRGMDDMIDRFGAVEALKNLKVHFYASNTTPDQQYQKAEAVVKADADVAYAKRVAELKNNLLSTLTLAFEASRKNFILENALKDRLVDNIKTANVPENVAIDMVEDAFQAEGPNYFHALLKKAEEWMGYEPEAYQEVKSTIQKMSALDPNGVAAQLEADEPVEEAPEYKSAVVHKAAAAPQEPQHTPEDDMASVRGLLRRAPLKR